MKVVLGVGGGIAAYKGAELARLLMERGHRVQAVMTRSAQEFIRPLTFAALTGQKVITDLFDSAGGAEATLASAVEHIGVAQENEALVVAPATANLLAKFSTGLADDFLSTLYLAFRGPVVLAPAMNTHMWEHPATRRNIDDLKSRGHRVVEPEAGKLACGTIGPGRLASLESIVAAVEAAAYPQDLEGETVLVTAGPTQEALDPVRFVSNRSSGKMGYALAEAAAARGARVVLVSGPVALAPPPRVEVVRVETTEQMRQAVLDHLEEASIVIKAAAVADYYIKDVPGQKLKKTATRLSLELDPTPDILAELGRLKGDRLLVGFAAETEKLEQEARRKLQTKNCDLIVGNLVSQEGIGFGSDENAVVLVSRTGDVVRVPQASKRQVADRIFDQILKLRLHLHAAHT